jgi:membrane protease YdiL (CAAX protease family)
MAVRHNSWIRRHPVRAFFALTFSVSWAGALAVAAPSLLQGRIPGKIDGILMLPAMILGPCLSSIFLTWRLQGRAGLRDLGSRLFRLSSSASWYSALLIPPSLILLVLWTLERLVSPVFTPNLFLIGVLFGAPAGLLEEVGWSGFAFPHMQHAGSRFSVSVLLGLLWALWHLPVIDHLGTATPHGDAWLPYFLSFAAAMTAMRVLIGWLYANTQSVLLTQLMHIASTGSLVVFSAPRVTPIEEAAWYGVYAVALWTVVLAVRAVFGPQLVRSSLTPLPAAVRAAGPPA